MKDCEHLLYTGPQFVRSCIPGALAQEIANAPLMLSLNYQ